MSSSRTLCILQPTPFCNINCDYCYLPHRSSSYKMDIDVFGKIAVELFSSKIVTAPIDFLWHLGEPLAVPISFYEKAFKIISQLGEDTGIEYSITFQTNAMLINQNWIDLFKKYKINIGLSIDGPAFIHDKKRVNKKNKGTHEQVMKGVGMLQEAKIPFGVIMVVTKDSLDYPDLICDFFLENGINDIGFNIDEMDGDHLKTSFEKIEDEKFKYFIQQLLKRSVESNGKFKVREFWLNIRPFTAEVNEPVNVANRPFGIFNFDCYGNYSTFCPELITAKNEEYNNFAMGNILTDKLDDILTNPIYLRVKREIEEGIEKCKNSCEYWSFCGGGCPSNKYFENGTFVSTDTVACKYHKKMIVDALADHLEQQFS
jgi:uncharacterized protein